MNNSWLRVMGTFAVSAAFVIASGLIISRVGDHSFAQTPKRGVHAPLGATTVVTLKDEQVLYNAEQILIQDCMYRHGFQYQINPFAQSASTPDLQAMYFISTAAWAERNGFGIQAEARTANEDPNESYITSLSSQRQAAYSLALYGIGQDSPQILVTMPQGGVIGHSAGGCQAGAEGELYGNFGTWFKSSSIVNDLPLVVLGQVIRNNRYRSELARWASCMHSKNSSYSWSSPVAAAAAFRAMPITKTNTLAETTAAVASAVCAATTGLSVTVRELNTGYTYEVMRRYRLEVEGYRQLQSQALPHAFTIVTALGARARYASTIHSH